MQRERHAHADAVAVQRRDHRLVERNADARDGAHQRLGRHHAAGAADLLDVGAGAERLAGRAAQHRDPHLRVVGDLLPDRAEPLLGRHVERIEHLRPVERDDRDAVCALFEQNRHFVSIVRRMPGVPSVAGHYLLFSAASPSLLSRSCRCSTSSTISCRRPISIASAISIPGQPAVTAFPRIKALWDVDARRALIDEFPGLQQILSLANPPLELVAPPDKSPDLARLANDELAEGLPQPPRPFSIVHRLAADEQCRGDTC